MLFMEKSRHEMLVLTKEQERILIHEMGYSRQRVYSWKIGLCRPRPKEAKKIAERLDMDFETLVGAG